MTDARLSTSLSNDNGRAPKTQSVETMGSWIATLSDGTTAVEHRGDWTVQPGEPTPWVRLTYFLGDNDLFLTSLRLNFQGRTIHLPRADFDKFNYLDRTIDPLYYALSYHLEAEMDMNGAAIEQAVFVDLAAHYQDFAVHYIQDTGRSAANSWVVVTDPDALAPTPRQVK